MIHAILAFLFLTFAAGAAQAEGKTPGEGAGKNFRDCPSCPDMVAVPAGEFMMGSPETERGRGKDEGPQHNVTIAKPFAAGKYEVTFAEWDACVADRGCCYKPGDEGWGRGSGPSSTYPGRTRSNSPLGSRRKPARTTGFSSEAEWEYAARGVTKTSDPSTPFSTGADHQLQAGQLRRELHLWPGLARRLSPEDQRCRLASRRTHSASTICTAMSGSGCRIATSRLMRARLRTARRSPPAIAICAFFAAAPGTITPSFCVPLIAMRRRPTFASTISASASREPFNAQARVMLSISRFCDMMDKRLSRAAGRRPDRGLGLCRAQARRRRALARRRAASFPTMRRERRFWPWSALREQRISIYDAKGKIMESPVSSGQTGLRDAGRHLQHRAEGGGASLQPL